MGARFYLWLGMALVATWAGSCHGHGRLIDPPSRASAWRYGFDTPVDYADNEGFCGGFTHQYEDMGGKCGICGDAWDEEPRPHEAGGLYATGTIVRTYNQGQVFHVRVDITANHMGHFEFRICPNNNPDVAASQTCLNDHPLFSVDGTTFKHYINSSLGVHELDLKLPEGLTCTQCVFQWRYVAGNNWGTCEDGTQDVGCGPQEEFRACADVVIASGTYGGQISTTTSASGGGKTDRTTTRHPTRPTTTPRHPTRPTTTPRHPTRPTTTTTRRPTTMRPTTKPQGSGKGCRAVGAWQKIPGMDTWCVRNCNHTPRFCPASHCKCY